ncbi:MAG TPA: hypothetical protein VEF33_10870, partial [Syntrophales bacterium]|nr:hypothetical protein [Syntrophales bacterium]
MLKNIYDKFINLGILPKLVISFLLLSVIPLIVVGYIANKNLSDTGFQAVQRAEEMGNENLRAAEYIGKTSIADSVQALDRKATEAIELRTVELAMGIADFLYERDNDILLLASLKPDLKNYLEVYRTLKRDVIATEKLVSGKKDEKEATLLQSQNAENKEAWRHLPPTGFRKISKPLYREITFVDIHGQERIKIADGRISNGLADISKKQNTYCKAEDYFSHLRNLKKGEIYVSRVIGAYVKGWLYKTPEGIRVRPESAYAGKENPHGKKFEG